MATNLFKPSAQPTAQSPSQPSLAAPATEEPTTESAILDTTASEESDRTASPPQATEPKEDGFERAIRTYLDDFAEKQPAFAAKYRSGKKTIRQCCDYLIDVARKKFMLNSGKCAAISDEETYGLAVHFFEEDSIKPVTNPTPAKVVTPNAAPSKPTTPSKPTPKPSPKPSTPKPTPKPSTPKPKPSPTSKEQPSSAAKKTEKPDIDLFDFAAENGIDLF